MEKIELIATRDIDECKSYDMKADYPVDFLTFLNEVLSKEDLPLVGFYATNVKYGGFTQNELVVERRRSDGKWHIVKSEPSYLVEKFSGEKIIACHVDKWWAHTSYYITFEEN